MGKRLGEGSTQPKALATAFAAGVVLLLASLANFLLYNDYPLLRLDVAVVVAAIIGLSAIMAFFYSAQRQWGRSLLEGALVALIVDLNTPWVAAAILLGIGVGAIGWWLKRSFIGPLAVLGSVILVTTLAGLGDNEGWIRETRISPKPASAPDKPAILHLILDEHLGIEGFREPDPDASRLRDELRSAYVGAGFRVYGGAYSEHMHTVNAIPYMLNYGRRIGRSVGKNGVEVGLADHLKLLTSRGYRLTILQSDFADLCTGNEPNRCVTYDSSSLRPTLPVPLTISDRVALIAWKFFALSDLLRSAAWKAADLAIFAGADAEPLKRLVDNGPRTSTAASLAALGQLTADLSRAMPGDAFVAHIIAPHEPYLVGADCRYLPRATWGYRHTPADIDIRRRLYRNQVRCVTRRVAEAVRALDQSPAGRNAIIVIHGDHGSRIANIDANEFNFGRFGDTELIATFSTLFAIRGPGIQPGYLTERQPVSSLLRDFASTEFRSAPEPRIENIRGLFLDDLDWRVRRQIPMPQSWRGPPRPNMGQTSPSK